MILQIIVIRVQGIIVTKCQSSFFALPPKQEQLHHIIKMAAADVGYTALCDNCTSMNYASVVTDANNKPTRKRKSMRLLQGKESTTKSNDCAASSS